jgi:hypothetical protein
MDTWFHSITFSADDCVGYIQEVSLIEAETAGVTVVLK